MSAFNPFRQRNVDGSTQENPAIAQPPINLPPDLFTKPIQPPASQLPNGYPSKSALSLAIEDDDSSSDDQTADPFNPDSSVSDNEDDERNDEHLRSSNSANAHSRDSVGPAAPHQDPSEDGSMIIPPSKTLSTPGSTTEVNEFELNTAEGTTATSSLAQSVGQRSPENDGHTSSTSRTDKEKKPPPPPRSHHGKRINVSDSNSRPESASRSSNRFSFHASSPESVASIPPSGTPNANANTSTSQQSTSDYFLMPAHNQQSTGSTDSLQRSQSQSKRPPTPPLSRRHSQMRRSKSTQSKSSNSRLTMSSLDSESNDSSQPPSPGPSTRSVPASRSQDSKRVSMPPPAPGETRAAPATPAAAPAALPGTGSPAESLSPPSSTRQTPTQVGSSRRASSYGSIATGSSSGAPPPPPPPRRGRESIIRSSDGGVDIQANKVEAPLPQPSNANDILADLSRLQKEVDDLRGHYESRKAD